MKVIDLNSKMLKFDDLLEQVKKSHFFTDNHSIKLNNNLLKEISINNIDLPFRIKCYAYKNNINSLEKFLNKEYQLILQCRNIGNKSITDSRKIILNYLQNINSDKRILQSQIYNHIIESKGNPKIVIKYYPLLQGIFQTTEYNYSLINCDLKSIHLPKTIQSYILNKPNLKKVNDILKINYSSLRCVRNIGYKTIKHLQTEIIDLLNLERIDTSNSINNSHRL